MNELEKFLTINGLDAVDAMNRMQNLGLVSDNCIVPADVAVADIPKAIQALNLGPKSAESLSR